MKEKIKHKIQHNRDRAIAVFKWVLFSFITGLILGAVGAVFAKAIVYVTELRKSHMQLLLLLPIGAAVIAALYKLLHEEGDRGTDSIIATIHGDEEVPLKLAPLIFVSTIFSHLCGASVGREGAALQMGGSIGNGIGRLFKFEQNDKNTMIMCGMSAVFSAMFGTPIAAAVFSMEVVSVGIMHYAALVPCVISAFVARRVAELFGLNSPFYDIEYIPAFNLKNALIIIGVAVACGLVSLCFCMVLHKGGRLVRRYIENRYIRGVAGG
ncbi:MAG: chloride channel protein, partial [Lachnospiraceae bacterium]|nr:chloride channel protein [Lachnospiraceae bacterium]